MFFCRCFKAIKEQLKLAKETLCNVNADFKNKAAKLALQQTAASLIEILLFLQNLVEGHNKKHQVSSDTATGTSNDTRTLTCTHPHRCFCSTRRVYLTA